MKQQIPLIPSFYQFRANSRFDQIKIPIIDQTMTQLLHEDLSRVGRLLFTQGEGQLWTDLMTVEPIK
jgi:hypothetical protein